MRHFKILIIAIGFFCLLPNPTIARENVNYWYIKNFESEIIVNKDSSLDITEKITADCGNAPDKHGIFRILPTRTYEASQKPVITPIKLESITDFNGKDYKYTEIKNRTDHTITWKIGDPNKTVQGVNNYQIKYKIKNAIRFENEKFDELYWNLNGAFWDLEIDQFSAKIIFPPEITKDNTGVYTYSGTFGSKDNLLTTYNWANNILEFKSAKTLAKNEGITASITFPKGIFTPAVLTDKELRDEESGIKSFLDNLFSTKTLNVLNKLGWYIPIFAFILSYLVWNKYGNDPNINRAIVPEFEIPEKYPPIELGIVYTNGTLRNQYVSAAIINLAVKKYIRIEKIEKKGILGKEDYKLILLKDSGKDLSDSERLLIAKLFSSVEEVQLSSFKNQFYTEVNDISRKISKKLTGQGLVSRTGDYIRLGCCGIIFLIFPGLIFSLIIIESNLAGLAFGIITSGIIAFIFALVMPKRPLKGVEMFNRIKGFRMYMETAEKYRQKFNEKENIFERFLPYAILFGITKLWINKMKDLYGEEYFNSYVPIWLAGTNLKSFDADGLNTVIDHLSANMATTLASSPSSSGSGGGGFSGGGGGGGGGGGW